MPDDVEGDVALHKDIVGAVHGHSLAQCCRAPHKMNAVEQNLSSLAANTWLPHRSLVNQRPRRQLVMMP